MDEVITSGDASVVEAANVHAVTENVPALDTMSTRPVTEVVPKVPIASELALPQQEVAVPVQPAAEHAEVSSVSVPPPVSPPTNAPNPIPMPLYKRYLKLAQEKIQYRKRAKLEKIVVEARTHGSITNDACEKLLHISDSTAQRYLAQLVKDGRLRRVGDHSETMYEPI
jgi:hypothetical protein